MVALPHAVDRNAARARSAEDGLKRLVLILVSLLAGTQFLGCGGSNQNSSSHVYVVNSSAGNIGIYNIQSDGSLALSNGSPFNVGSNATCLIIAPNGKFAYSVNKGQNTINVFVVNSDGTLSAPSSSGNTTDQGYPTNLVMDSSGKYLFAADSGLQGNPGISFYTVDPNAGTLTANGSITLTSPPTFLATSGGFLYAAFPSTGNIQAFGIGSTGQLTAVGSAVSAGVAPVFLAFSGNYLLSADNGQQSVDVFSINTTTGALSPVAGSPFPAGQSPSAIAVSGQNVFVTNQNSNTVSVFSIDANSGALGEVSGSPYTTNGQAPVAVGVSPQGNALYVADEATSKIDEYQIGTLHNFLTVTPFHASPISADGAPVWITVH